MEATRESGLLDKIRQPRVEDAGLEDSALPPEFIKKAFLKGASVVRSIISHSSDDEGEGHCVNGPWPTFGVSSDTVVGIEEGVEEIPGGCAAEKGRGPPDMAGDEVAVKDVEEKVDEAVVGGPTVPSGGKPCVDGFQGLEIEGKGSGITGKKLRDGDHVDEGNDDEKDGERPILAGGYV